MRNEEQSAPIARFYFDSSRLRLRSKRRGMSAKRTRSSPAKAGPTSRSRWGWPRSPPGCSAGGRSRSGCCWCSSCSSSATPRARSRAARRRSLSPADGRVLLVGKVRDPYLDREALKISVFMNVFDVHSNRSPVTGTVLKTWYNAGSFLNAVARQGLVRERAHGVAHQNAATGWTSPACRSPVWSRAVSCATCARAIAWTPDSATGSSASARGWTSMFPRPPAPRSASATGRPPGLQRSQSWPDRRDAPRLLFSTRSRIPDGMTSAD